MRPVTFTCGATLPLAAAAIAGRILDVADWPSFTGYGPLPGIASASFEVRTPDVVGSRIRVRNTDGSGHVEEIVDWEPGRQVRLVMTGFSPPLSRLATRFEETWTFAAAAGGTSVTRPFELHPRSAVARSCGSSLDCFGGRSPAISASWGPAVHTKPTATDRSPAA